MGVRERLRRKFSSESTAHNPSPHGAPIDEIPQMDFSVKTFAEVRNRAGDLPAGVKLVSPSLFQALLLHGQRPCGLNSIVVIDARWPTSNPSLVGAISLWSDSNRVSSADRKRIRAYLKCVCDLKTVLVFGGSSSPQDKDRDKYLQLMLGLLATSQARVKETLVLAGGVKAIVEEYREWCMHGNPSVTLPVTEIVSRVVTSGRVARPAILVATSVAADVGLSQQLLARRDVRSIIHISARASESMATTAKRYMHVAQPPAAPVGGTTLGVVSDALRKEVSKGRSVLIAGPLSPFCLAWWLVEVGGNPATHAVRHINRKLPSFKPTTELMTLLQYLETHRGSASYRADIDKLVASGDPVTTLTDRMSWDEHMKSMGAEVGPGFVDTAATLQAIFSNIVNNPSQQRFRSLQLNNQRVQTLLQFESVRRFLEQVGWRPVDSALVFSGDMQSLRDNVLRLKFFEEC